MEPLINALLSAVLAVAYHGQLIMPGKILEPFHRKLSQGVNWTLGTWAYPIVEFTTHSLRECVWCLAGQLALLHYLTTSSPSLSFAYLFGALFQTGAAIYLSAIVLKTLQDATKEEN
jgi:hypothetical protein